MEANSSCCHRLVQLVKTLFISACTNITIEPVVLLYLTAMGMNEVIRPNLLLDKACYTKFNYTEEVCDHLNEDIYEDELKEVQRAVTKYERNLGLFAFIPRVTYAIFGGAWSDRYGRKFIIALPIFGQVLANITFLVNNIFMHELPFEFLYLEFVNELCGSFVLYYLAVYSYIADITTAENRTSRLSVLDGCDYMFTMVGTALSGRVYVAFGYVATFSAGCGLASLAVLYTVFVVKESVHQRTAEEKAENQERPLNSEQNANYGSSNDVRVEPEVHFWNRLLTTIDSYTGFITVFKRRHNRKRLMILMLVFNFTCYIFAYNGTEGSHRQLYAYNKYDMTPVSFSTYLVLYRVYYMVTLWIAVPILSRILRLHDATIAILACITTAAGMVLPAVLWPVWAFFVGSVLTMLNPSATITARSMISRCVDEDEIGRIFSVISLMSAVSSSLMASAFQEIYGATLNSFLGTFLCVNAAFMLATVPNNIYLRLKL